VPVALRDHGQVSGVAGERGGGPPRAALMRERQMGVKLNKFGISKLVVARVKYRFVDFCFQTGALSTALL